MGQFKNRSEAGRLLASHLESTLSRENLIVVALPRGGVVVAEEISKRLKVRLEILIVKKLRAPTQPELALGAIASGGFIYLNHQIVESLGITNRTLANIKKKELIEVQKRESLYQCADSKMYFLEKRLLLVDDGIATGATMEVAIRALKAAKAYSIDVAVPVATLSTVEMLRRHVDHVFALQTPFSLGAVGEFYEDFAEVSDEQVIQIFRESKLRESKEESVNVYRK